MSAVRETRRPATGGVEDTTVKAPRRHIACSIAGKTVMVTLRKGGGFHEPAVPYVRCDDRDCQYVDLNEPPCPLRRNMFRDSRAPA